MKDKQPNYTDELERDYVRWNKIYINGCSDPAWSDGTNLWLVRNHIIHDRQQIEANMSPEDYPEAYYREIPPEVDRDYMARAEEIRINAQKTLEAYKKDANHAFIITHKDSLSAIERQRTVPEYIYCCASGLESSILRDDLVAMRRHQSPEYYLKRFAECAVKIRETLNTRSEPQIEQFTLFSA